MGTLRLQRKRCPKSKVVLAGIIALLIATIWLGGPGCKWRLRWFLNEWRSVADPESLREWAVKKIDVSKDSEETLCLWGAVPVRDGSTRKARPQDVFSDAFLRHSDGPPQSAVVFRSGKVKDDHVVVTWGGGFGHWGLKIGRHEYRPARDDGFDHLEWCPGIYAWHEIQ